MPGTNQQEVTFRSIVIGVSLIPATCMFVVMTEVVWLSGYPSVISLFYNVVLILFLLALGNHFLEKIRPRWVLSSSELLVIYTMLSIASALSGVDMLQVLTPAISHLHYVHGVERRFGDILPYVPEWLLVSDPVALSAAYAGQESIFRWGNLAPWLKPLSWWSLFVSALCMVMWSMNLFLRRQWTQNEKLAYPIIQVPMLISDDLMGLLKSKMFWIGFGISGSICMINGLNALYPVIPSIPIGALVEINSFFPERPWSEMGWAPVALYPFAIGICFFIPLDLAFSCWFFWMLFKGMRVFASYTGIHGMPGFPFIEEQRAGGYYAIALMALWISRRHLIYMFRLLIGATQPIDSSDVREARIAAALLFIGSAFIVAFCHAAGMDFHIIFLFFGLYFLLSFSVTRIRAELGPPAVDTFGLGPHLQIVRFLGAGEMARANRSNLTMLGLLATLARTSRSHPMPHGMEGFRIGERQGMQPMRLFIAMAIAIIAGILFSFATMVYVYNRYGITADILGVQYYLGEETWNRTNTWIMAPERWSAAPVLTVGIGFVFAFGLAVLRMNLAWFPFHPVGFAMGGAAWTMDLLWMPFMTAWIIKLLILKYGGAKAYRPAVPFFIGLIMGDFLIGGSWIAYGTLMGVKVYHFWP